MAVITAPETALDASRRALEGYREAADRFFDFVPTLESFAQDDSGREVARLLHRQMRVRTGILREWLLSPLWLTGVATPADLNAQVQKAIETDRQLAEAWADLVSAQGERQTRSTVEALNVVGETIDRSMELTGRTVTDIREFSRATSDASAEAATQAIEATERLLETAREDAETAAAQAESNAIEALRRAAELAGNAAPATETRAQAKPAVPATRSKIVTPVVKGNTTRTGEKIFHVPGQSSYEQLQSDEMFASQSDAIAAGYRISRSPGGPAIRGNIGRDGSRIYHMPGQVNYDRVEAEALFATEEEAAAEGFRPAQR